MTTLATLAVGDIARVLGFGQCDKAYRHKLMAMGLTRGAEFSLIRVAPLGDPVEIEVRGCALSLRKNEASMIRIEKVAVCDQ